MICNQCGELIDPKTGSVVVLCGDDNYFARMWMEGQALQFEKSEEGSYKIFLISCGTCVARAKEIRRGVDKPHNVRITIAYGENRHVPVRQFPTLQKAQDFLRKYVEEWTGSEFADFQYEIINMEGEVVEKTQIDNGNPDWKSWMRNNCPDATAIHIFNEDTTYFHRDFSPNTAYLTSWEGFKLRCTRLGGWEQYGSVCSPVTLTLTNLDGEIVDSLKIEAKTDAELEVLRKSCTLLLETYRKGLEGTDIVFYAQTYVADIEYAQGQFDRHVEAAEISSTTTKIRLLNKYSGDVLREWIRS